MSDEEGSTSRPLPRHVTLPLLSLVTSQAMDEDYQQAAAARKESGTPVDPLRRRNLRIVTGVVVGVFGILVSVAAVQTSRTADVNALGRASLIARIQEERADVGELAVRIGELRAENAEAADRLRQLREEEAELDQRLDRLGVATGYLAVRGPGLRITVDDPPDADETHMVRDDDLAILVDGLWAAGAEAIAINGHRLTVLSSIQNSGQAIHVNARPLSPPYEVLAIGNPDTLQARLLSTTHGSVFFGLARYLGFGFEMEEDGSLELPAARTRPLRSAEVWDGAEGKEKEIDP